MKTIASKNQDSILLVDDEENILRSLRRELMDMPYGLLTVSSGSEALELLHAHTFAVVITDQRMPGVTGTELLSIVRERYPDTVRILLTAFSDMQDIVDAINKCGIYKYIQKPWKSDELKAVIAGAVDLYHLKRDTDQTRQCVQPSPGLSGFAMDSKNRHAQGGEILSGQGHKVLNVTPVMDNCPAHEDMSI